MKCDSFISRLYFSFFQNFDSVLFDNPLKWVVGKLIEEPDFENRGARTFLGLATHRNRRKNRRKRSLSPVFLFNIIKWKLTSFFIDIVTLLLNHGWFFNKFQAHRRRTADPPPILTPEVPSASGYLKLKLIRPCVTDPLASHSIIPVGKSLSELWKQNVDIFIHIVYFYLRWERWVNRAGR